MIGDNVVRLARVLRHRKPKGPYWKADRPVQPTSCAASLALLPASSALCMVRMAFEFGRGELHIPQCSIDKRGVLNHSLH